MILRPRQRTFVERSLTALKEYGNTLGVAPTGCHAPGTLILLYNGHTIRVEDICVGDQLMGPDSRPRTVLELHQGQDDLFEIQPTHGDSFIVNAGHILSLVNGKEFIHLSVLTYCQKGSAFKRRHLLYRTAVDFPARERPDIDPYIMGLLINERYLNGNMPCITDDYKLGTQRERQALLAGLIDREGELLGQSVVIYSHSLALVNDVAFVARSVGFFARTTSQHVNGDTEFSVILRGDFSALSIRRPQKKPLPTGYKKNPLRSAFTVRPVGYGDYVGFSVDGDHLYVMGDFTVTHNSGKTIMLSAVAGNWLKSTTGKACVLAHRDELTAQNKTKFLRVNPNMRTSVFDAQQKNWEGQVTFSMVQTLSRESGLKQIPELDLLVIDEAHHAAADSYRRVIEAAQSKNPNIALFGVTATPNRADSKGLRDVFSNVSDQITLSELIASGHLVKPITYDIDLGQRDALSKITGSTNVIDHATNQLLNNRPTNDSVVKHWREKAGDRQTIVFCSTVDHARDVAAAFQAEGIATECIHGKLSPTERQAALSRYESQQSQVVVNVAVLTEGYDYPPTSCVVLLRLSSHKSTFLQMVGRGLRTVNPNDYPGITKVDCIVLDFGTSTSSYGRLEETVDLDGSTSKGEVPKKNCPECDALIPLAARSCFICDHIFESTPKDLPVELADFVMTEVELLNQSLFQWCDLFGDEAALMATGFEAWAGLFYLSGQWYAVGGLKKVRAKLLAVGEKLVCLAAADDWLGEHETEKAALKSKHWLHQVATQQQLRFLNPRYRQDHSLTRYHASCLLAFKFNKRDIHSIVFVAEEQSRVA